MRMRRYKEGSELGTKLRGLMYGACAARQSRGRAAGAHLCNRGQANIVATTIRSTNKVGCPDPESDRVVWSKHLCACIVHCLRTRGKSESARFWLQQRSHSQPQRQAGPLFVIFIHPVTLFCKYGLSIIIIIAFACNENNII